MDKLEELKTQATELGITFRGNIGADTLALKIQGFLEDEANEAVEKSKNKKVKKSKNKAKKGKKGKKAKTAKEKQPSVSLETITDAARRLGTSSVSKIVGDTPAQRNAKTRNKMLRKVRVKIVVYDPTLLALKGLIIKTRNQHSGSIGHFVNFDGNAQHLPLAIVNILKERTYSKFFDVKDPISGIEVRKSKQANTFHVQELPALTRKEMSDLADLQASNGTFKKG